MKINKDSKWIKIAALVITFGIGAGLGSGMNTAPATTATTPAATTSSTPAPTVTETVEVVPQTCLDAINLADQTITQQAQIIQITSNVIGTNVPTIMDAMLALDANTIESETAKIDSATTDVQNIKNAMQYDEYQAAATKCKTGN